MSSRNIQARDAFTTAILGAPIIRARTAAEAQEALFGHLYKKPGMATPDDCVYWAKRVAKALGQDAFIALLQRHGCQETRITPESFKDDLWAGLWQPFTDYAMTAVYFGLSPQWAWDVAVRENDFSKKLSPYIPDPITRKPVEELRSRWLLHHAESDCYFEVDSWAAAERVMTNGSEEVLDVTGVLVHENNHEAQR